MKINKEDSKLSLQINNKEIPLKKDEEFFFVKDNKAHFIKNAGRGFTEDNKDILVNKIKLLFKKYPRFFSFVYIILGASFVGKNAKKAIEKLNKDKIILNLGSGVKRVRDDVINIDFYPFQNVDIVADIARLPFIDNSIDAVINEFVLEHVKNPEVIVREIYRVLKPEGILYLAVPFVASFHSSPSDYYRWTKLGMREMLKSFKEIECGVRCGPTSALVYIFSEWLATILSLGFTKIQQIFFLFFLIILSPLNLIDFLISKFSTSENIAYGFYFVGKK
ncbi:MAG: methyltransferase domain-containing protein [Patescibacteria group bacterium]